MHAFSRVVLTLLAISQGVLMLAIELNNTHATHPQWPGHARFHLVWQNLTTALFSALVVVLLWCPGPLNSQRFFLAAAIVAVPLVAFTGAVLARSLYDGRMADVNGVPPVRFALRDKGWLFDGNILAVAVGLVALLIALAAYK